ncbi:MAG: hypothetical protein JNN29_08195 [Chitinophagaceae bacterium]|nr:hypothetical protein [Chitinophagaceae bacterium]MBN8667219.1 hypothetical protein [Chitinophagales bacterium]
MIENFVLIANLSSFIPLAIFLYHLSLTKNVNYAKAVAGASVYALLIFGYYLAFPHHVNKYFDAVNYFGEFLAFSTIFYFSFNGSLFRKIVLFAGIAFVLFFIIYLSAFVITELDPIINSVKSIILIVLALLVFYEKFQMETDKVIYYDHKFWGIIGLIIFICGTFLFYLVYTEYYLEMQKLEGIPLTLYVLKNIFLSISMLLLIKQIKKSSGRKEKDIPFLDLE